MEEPADARGEVEKEEMRREVSGEEPPPPPPQPRGAELCALSPPWRFEEDLLKIAAGWGG